MAILVSERVGEFLHEGHRLEYTEYGGGDRTVVLLHGQLMPRQMHEPLARFLASEGLHVYTLDLLGHGRSDRPADASLYSMTAFGRQVMTLLDHLDVERAVVGGSSLGANVTLEVASAHPDRLAGMVLEMPVLDNALKAGIVAFSPLIFAAEYAPWSVNLLRRMTRVVPRSLVPFWLGVALDTLGQYPPSLSATVHGVFFGRLAPGRDLRRQIELPALVVGHPHDPIHPAADAAMLADELPNCEFVTARSIVEWRARPDRLNQRALEFVTACFAGQAAPSDVASDRVGVAGLAPDRTAE